MYGSSSPSAVTSVPASRACTMVALRPESSLRSAPSCTKSWSSRARWSLVTPLKPLKHLSATGNRHTR